METVEAAPNEEGIVVDNGADNGVEHLLAVVAAEAEVAEDEAVEAEVALRISRVTTMTTTTEAADVEEADAEEEAEATLDLK